MEHNKTYHSKRRIAAHSVFWIIWITGFSFLQSFGFPLRDFGAWLIYYLVTLPLFMAHTYSIAYWLVPKYFFGKRYIVFSFWIVVFLMVASIAELLISNELVWKLVKPELMQPDNYLNFSNILINGLGNEYIVVVFLSIKVIGFWNSKMGEKNAIQNRKMAMEIELLQYQYYPRFVLNVMDRIEQLAIGKSSLTSELIIRFSGMMNNLSSRKKSETIPIGKEIDLIKSYIEIQNAGKPKKTRIRFKVHGKHSPFLIPPFLFFQVIEEGTKLLDENAKEYDFAVDFYLEPQILRFSMAFWIDHPTTKIFSRLVLDNIRTYLIYFYPENHQVISNIGINFVEIKIEITSQP